MSIIGSCFALGIVILISSVYFRNRYFLTRASKYYIVCLILTALSALANICKSEISRINGVPVWTVFAIGAINHMLIIFSTSVLALYLICKVTEHVFEDKRLFAKISLSIICISYISLIILNFFNLWLFTVNEAKEYQDGSMFFLLYIFVALQLGVVAVYCMKHKKRLNNTAKMAFFECIPAVAFCIALKFIYPEMSLFILGVSLIELIFYLNFQNHLNGINTLTKLNDGRGFFTEIRKRIRVGADFKAYAIKIRNIGAIKQNYGHRAGDELLYLFAFYLGRLFSDAIPFHMYGTTFTLVLPSDEKQGSLQTEKLTEFLETKIKYASDEITLDYILAEHNWSDEANADVFYEKLEYAMEIAKLTKQKYIKCSLELEITRLRKKYLISRLQNIDKQSGYEIWFQPIYSTKEKNFPSAEVLIRLKESNGSYISPAEFIPIAEKTGQIVPITWFVIEKTCQALSENPVLNNLKVSINLPMLHLIDPSFEAMLSKIVDGYGIEHNRISFEFTERVILEDLVVAEKNMRQLTESGYSFYLDDFGVGYSNFNCVLRLPLKTVKLDMSLTSTAKRLRENYGLVNVLTDLFHDMGMNVVAEGAETAEQVELLKSFGVDCIQGYYFAKPMPITKLKDFIEKNSKNT